MASDGDRGTPVAVSVPRRTLRGRGLPVAAVAGCALGCLVALLAWTHAQSQWQAAAVEAFGRVVAEDVARLAVEPLMRQDRIGLGLLTNRIAERAQVRGIAVHTVDGRPFVVVGETAGQDSPTFATPVVVEDSVVGQVRVALDSSAFALSLGSLLLASWWYWPIGLALAAGGGLLAARGWPPAISQAVRRAILRDKAASSSEAAPRQLAEAEPPDADALVLVANLFSRAGLAAAERDEALRRCLAAAQAVARQHGGNAESLDRVGVAVTFAGARPDAAYAALRGALALRAAMAQADATPRFRYGLDRLANTVAEPASAVALLAALAADGELLLGASAFASLEQPDRLLLTPIDDPALRPLSPVARPSQVVQGVATDLEAELAAEAAAIAAALR